MSLHWFLAVRSIDVAMRKTFNLLRRTEGSIIQRKSPFGRAGSPGGNWLGDRQELFKQIAKESTTRRLSIIWGWTRAGRLCLLRRLFGIRGTGDTAARSNSGVSGSGCTGDGCTSYTTALRATVMMMKRDCANQNDGECEEENEVSWSLHDGYVDRKDEAVLESIEKKGRRAKTDAGKETLEKERKGGWGKNRSAGTV